MKIMSAAEANRRFSELLREVARGRDVLVTSRGRPVARVVPASRDLAARKAGRAALLKRLKKQPIRGRRAWTRESLYE
jgi:prevent-host-death family protein